MKKLNSALSAGLGYTIGNILVKGINFIMLPVFSRIMSTEEFGVYNVFLSYDAILSIIIGMALHVSIKSANYKFPNKINQYTSSISIIYIGNALILLILNLIFGQGFSKILFLPERILYLLILYSFGNAVLTLYNTRISLDYSYKKYLIAAFANSFGNVTLSLIFIMTAFSARKEIGRILGVVITIFFIAILLLYDIYRQAKPQYNKSYWKFGIHYSLPIIPHGISQVLLAQFDRIMISQMVSSSAAGIYSLAGNIKLIITIITESISNAWSTWFYAEMEKKHRDNIQVRAKQICCLFTIIITGTLAVSPELIYLLGGNDYRLGKYVAVPMILDAYILFVYNVFSVAEYYTQKTIFIMIGTITSAILNIILNYIFILKYGFITAAYTTLFSYACYLFFHIVIAYKMVHFHVIPLKYLGFGTIMVTGYSVFVLFHMESVYARYALCLPIILLFGSYLINDLIKNDIKGVK